MNEVNKMTLSGFVIENIFMKYFYGKTIYNHSGHSGHMVRYRFLDTAIDGSSCGMISMLHPSTRQSAWLQLTQPINEHVF